MSCIYKYDNKEFNSKKELADYIAENGFDNPNQMSEFTNHSGGAIGSDNNWDMFGRQFGVINHNHYREPGATKLDSNDLVKKGIKPTIISQKDYEEGQPKATIAARQMGRIASTHQSRSNYIIRNWAQVKYADAIFAIGTIIPKGTKMNNDKVASIEQVKGGTGYAVQMAINEGKPVNVYDGTQDSWFKYDYTTQKFIKQDTPLLTKNFAGIGSRSLSTKEVWEKSDQAIKDVYQKAQDYMLEEGKTSSTPVKKGVNEIFNENSELSSIGTEQQYSKYLDTIFPTSKVKDVLWHSSKLNNVSTFKESYSPEENRNQQFTTYGTYFSPDINYAKGYNKGQLVPILYNSKSLKNVDNYNDFYILQSKPTNDAFFNKDSNEYVVFDPKQIHILGSKQDIAGFKDFIGTSSNVVSDTESQENVGDHIESKAPSNKQEAMFTTKIDQYNYTYNPNTGEVIHNTTKGDKIEIEEKQVNKVLIAYARNHQTIDPDTQLSYNKSEVRISADERLYYKVNGKVISYSTYKTITAPVILDLFKERKYIEETKSEFEFTYKGITIPTKFALGDQQKKALEKSIDYIDNPGKNNFFTIEGSAGCLALDTKVLMFDGSFKKVQNVIVGDKLMGIDSTPRTVEELKRGSEQMYWVRQNKGMDYRVNENHILSLKTVTPKKYARKTLEDGSRVTLKDKIIHDKKVKTLNISVKDYFKLDSNTIKHSKGYVSNLLEFSEKEYPIDPYYLGLWLGDGTTARISEISSADEKILIYLESKYGKLKQKDPYTYNFVNKELLNNFKKLYNLNNGTKLKEKYIPSNYIQTSSKVRLQLLAGLIDSDGHYSIKGKYYEIIQKKKHLAEQIVYITRSLGFKTKITSKKAKVYNKDCGIVYRITFSPECEIPVILDRKKQLTKSEFKNRKHTGITLEKDVVDNYYGFSLDGDNLFMLEDFTVTHNTGKTTIVGYVQKYYEAKKSRTKFNYLAPTHAATAQLALTTVELGNRTIPFTVASSFYSFTKNGREISGFQQKLGLSDFGDNVLVVDETSMIEDGTLGKFIQLAKDKDIRVIFMGDSKQIPSPDPKSTNGKGQKVLNRAFGDGNSSVLTKVYRQNKSNLLTVLDGLKTSNIMDNSMSLNNDGTISVLDTRDYNKSVVNDFTNDPENVIYIAYTNAAVQKFNKSIKEVVTGQLEVKVGDKIVGYAGKDTKQILRGDIANSIPYIITDMEQIEGKSMLEITAKSDLLQGLSKKGILGIPNLSKTRYAQLSDSDSIKIENVTREQMNATNKYISEKIGYYYDKWIELSKKPYSPQKYVQEKNLKTDIESYFGSIDFGNDYFYNPKSGMLELTSTLSGKNGTLFSTKKGLDYGYAITAHKSQGMTINKAYVDFENIYMKGRSQEIINKKGEIVNTEKNALYYVAMSRARNNVTIKETSSLNTKVNESDKLFSSNDSNNLENEIKNKLKQWGAKTASGKSVDKIFSNKYGEIYVQGVTGESDKGTKAQLALDKLMDKYGLPEGTIYLEPYKSKSTGVNKNPGKGKLAVKFDFSIVKEVEIVQEIAKIKNPKLKEKLERVYDNDSSKNFEETENALASMSDKLHASDKVQTVDITDLFKDMPKKDSKKKPKKKGEISQRFQSTLNLALDNRKRLSEKKQRYYKKYKSNTLTRNEKAVARKLFNKTQAEYDAIEQQIKEIRKYTELKQTLGGAAAHMNDLREFFEQEKITKEDLAYAKKLIHAYKEAGTIIKDKDHLFLTPTEVNSMLDPNNDYMRELRLELLNYANEVSKYEHQLKLMDEALVEDTVEEKFSVKQDTNTAEDIGGTASSVLDISHNAQPMIQAASQWYKKQKNKTVQESREIKEKIMDLYSNALKKHSIEKINGLMAQRVSNDDNRKTNGLTMLFSQKFWDTKKTQQDKMNRVLKAPKATPSKRKKAVKDYIDWLRDNQVFFDPRKLRPRESDNFTAEEIKTHENFLKELIGEHDYDSFLKQMDKKIELYEIDRFNKEEDINELELPDAEKAKMLQLWEEKHSPYNVASNLIDGTKKIVSGQFASTSAQYLIQIPSNNPDYYDNNYKTIMKDDALRELHTYTRELLKELQTLMPDHMRYGIQQNTLPTIAKTLSEQINMNGLKAPKEILQFIQDSLSTTSKEVDVERDPDGKIKKEIRVKYLINNKEEIDSRLAIAHIKFNRLGEYVDKNGKVHKNSWNTVEKEVEKDIIDDIANEKSSDIGATMALFAESVINYKNNIVMEAFVNSVTNVINNQKDHTGAELTNTKAMWDHFSNHFHSGQIRDKEGETNVKTYSRVEKKKRGDLQEELTMLKLQLEDKKISEDTYNEKSNLIIKMMGDMGSNVHASSTVDALLSYVQFKNMGWNLPSSVSNVAFGKIAGYIQASAGNYYNMPAYNRASNLGWHSIARSGTFNKFTTDTAKKSRVWMDKLNTLKEARNELFESSSASRMSKLGSMFKWASPYNAQARGEYLVQSIDMNALAIETKVFKGDEETTLYDIMNIDGTLKPGYSVKSKNGKDPFTAEYYLENIYVVKLADVIAENHGNYDTDKPILRKKDAFGRAISQFRTWMFEGANNRFGYSYNKVTGDYFKKYYEDETITRKGRYRTGIGAFVWNADTDSGLGNFEKNKATVIAALRSMVPGLYAKDYLQSKGFKNFDAGNIAANIMEMNMFLASTAAMLLVKAALPDDEDKNSNSKLILTAMINQLNRVQMDLQFYANPTELENLSKNLIPLMSLMEDAGKIGHAAVRQFTAEDPSYQSGIHEGMNPLLIKIGKAAPVTNAGIKLYDNTAIIFGE